VNTGFGKNGSIIMGSNFADNKGNATVYVTYDNQGSALQSKFDYSACTLGGPNGGQPPPLLCEGSGTSKGGRFYASTPHGSSFIHHTVMPNGTFQNIGTPGNADTYNYGPLNYYQTPNVRWTGGAFVNYDINSHVNAYMNVMFMRNEMDAQIAPSGDFYQPSFIACANPLVQSVPTAKALICDPANWALQGNPTENYNGTSYPGLNFLIGRRNVEGGDRIAHFNNDATREVAGLKGDFGDTLNAWTWNASAQHSLVDTSDSNLNYTGNTQIQQSLNALPGPGGKTVCGGPTAPYGPLVPTSIYYPFNPTTVVSYGANSQCVPWNIWQPGGVTPQQLAYLSIPAQQQGQTEEYVVTGSVTGDLGKYGIKTPWADSGLQANVGAEWRSESVNFEPDFEEETANLGGGGGSVVPINGAFHVKEVFTELRMPLASHQPFADDLSIEGGYRYSDYNAGGGFTTNTYKLGLDWAPIRDIRLRGSYQRAVRAPNIGELYTPQAVLLDGSTDPCTGAHPHASLAGCELSGVLPAQYGKIPGNPAAQYNGLLGGNTGLVPETADTYTIGLVLQPRWVQNLSVSLDYFHIKIDNVIGAIGGNAILLNCVGAVGLPQQAAKFCPLVHRDPSGSLWRTTQGYVSDITQNEGELLTEGVDLNVSYRHSLATFGSLAVNIQGTYTQDLTTTPVPGYGAYNCVGYFGATCGGGNPKWRQVTNWTWSTPWSGFDLNLRLRYFGGTKSERLSQNPFLTGNGNEDLALASIHAYTYLDLSGNFNVYKNVTLQLGVNNITDKVPPLVVGADCSTSTPNASGANCNGNTFPGFYDAMGRYVFAHVTAQF
jgi:outer membrane receptor protein involved in Fe transport